MELTSVNINEGFTEGEEPLHFFYDRESRISRAPKNVQDYYAGKSLHFSRNIFKIMFAKKSNRYMFIFLLLFAGFVWFMSVAHQKNSATIGNVPVTLNAFSYDGEVFFSLELKVAPNAKKTEFSGQTLVSAVLHAVNSDGAEVWSGEVSGVYDGSSSFMRTKCTDYDILTVYADVTIGTEQKELSSRVTKRL